MSIDSIRSDAPFRPFPLDGAMLFFDRTTGTSVRAHSERTKTLRRIAPRVVMFGVTNACNLRCEFCSRDASRESLWTVDSAFDVLRGLSEAGTLEVAFGGGEPFAFRGFDELLTRLRNQTALALNVTTNGTLLTDERLRGLRGVLGQVRLSLYEDADWRRAANVLALSGQLWGANVLVDRDAVLALPTLLRELALRGCHDVSLLSYVGDDDSRALRPDDEALLDALITAAPLPVRLSVCFGHRLSAPRLFEGSDDSGDCGAGYDFVTITPDKRLQSCSFQNEAQPIECADDVLRLWREQSERLRAPSPRNGCSRRMPRRDITRSDVVAPELRVWRGFSGNNSGECLLVARFETVEAANAYLADLLPGYAAREPYSEPWWKLFEREHLCDAPKDFADMPHVLVAIGSTVIAEGYDAGDAFPELRALAWKRGADVDSGIHLHDPVNAVFAIACESPDAAKGLAASRPEGVTEAVQHGDVVIGYATLEMNKLAGDTFDWAALKPCLEAWAGSRKLSVGTVFATISPEDFVAARQRLRAETIDEPAHLATYFVGEDSRARAERFAALATEATGTRANSLVWFDGAGRRKRLAVLGYRHDSRVDRIRGNDVVINASIAPKREPIPGKKQLPVAVPLDVDTVRAEIEKRLIEAVGSGHTSIESIRATWGEWIAFSVTTDQPREVAPAIANYARDRDLQLYLVVEERDPLRHTLAAVIDACKR